MNYQNYQQNYKYFLLCFLTINVSLLAMEEDSDGEIDKELEYASILAAQRIPSISSLNEHDRSRFSGSANNFTKATKICYQTLAEDRIAREKANGSYTPSMFSSSRKRRSSAIDKEYQEHTLPPTPTYNPKEKLFHSSSASRLPSTPYPSPGWSSASSFGSNHFPNSPQTTQTQFNWSKRPPSRAVAPQAVTSLSMLHSVTEDLPNTSKKTDSNDQTMNMEE